MSFIFWFEKFGEGISFVSLCIFRDIACRRAALNTTEDYLETREDFKGLFLSKSHLLAET